MRLLVLTNTFTPHVGGVARSVEAFTSAYRRLGHRVVVVAPHFGHEAPEEPDVVRVPAIQKFNGSDFSVPVPVPGLLAARVEALDPNVIHSHHPFLLGDTALRVAATRGCPIVFTHHTMYERYTHYVPGDSPRMQRFVVELATGYANLCDAVVAPSETIADILRHRGVERRIQVIPTGVDGERFRAGRGARARERLRIPKGAIVIGHVGRLAPEKNLGFLGRALASFLERHTDAFALVVGDGPSATEIEAVFQSLGVRVRLRMAGVLEGQDLVDAFHALDVFAFSSQSETQGMVLTEAMAAGVPVVAVDAPGVREVVRDRANGRLLPEQDHDAFVAALAWTYEHAALLRHGVSETADRFSLDGSAARGVALYEDLIGAVPRGRDIEASPWEAARRRLGEEWKIAKNIVTSAGNAWNTLDLRGDGRTGR